jgi:hypothetical protein
MKNLSENIDKTREHLKIGSSDITEMTIENQLAMMQALQDIQEKMMRIEGKMRSIKFDMCSSCVHFETCLKCQKYEKQLIDKGLMEP